MKDVIVIGGGASGLVAAIFAALNNNKVTLLERNDKCGKKLLITGNGKCNYWNSDQNLIHYHTNDIHILKEIKTKENDDKLLDFFDSIGIVPKIKNGYYYPYSNQATSITNALITKAKLLNVEIINNFYVEEIINNDYFIINPYKENIIAKNVVITTGGMAASKTGSDGNGYALAKVFGHTIIKPLPALTSLIGNGNNFKKLKGVRCDGTLALYEDNKEICKETGEIQFTDYGISGICTFNISHYVSTGLDKGKNEIVKINFVPWLNSSLEDYLNKKAKKMKGYSISQILDGFLNYKIVNLLLEISHIKNDDIWENINKENKKLLINNITNFKINIIGTNSFDKAQVTTGGIPLTEINPRTMESNKTKGLYFAGEILDVDGDCGGYNLGFAFITGMIAGKSIKGDNND